MVTDASGNPVAGVGVDLTATAGSVTSPVTTGWDGSFNAAYTAPASAGQATVTATVTGTNISASTTISVTGTAQQGLTITGVRLEELDIATGKYVSLPSTPPPDGNGGPQTTDGNVVRVTVTVQNSGAAGVSEMALLADDGGFLNQVDATFDGLKSTDVVFTWDTSGDAWDVGGSAHRLPRKLQISVGLPGSGGVATTESVLARPRPLILVHGIQSDYHTWDAYTAPGGFLTNVSPYWKGFAVGDPSVVGSNGKSLPAMNMGDGWSLAAEQTPTYDIDANAEILAGWVDQVRANTNAEHVDIVAHSMGGLVSRFYIQELMDAPPDSHPVVSNLIMLGTPNEGTPCTIPLVGGWKPTMQELTPQFVAGFDQQVTNARGVSFSVLAGNLLPRTCLVAGPGDEVVPVTSAEWNLTDTATVGELHTQLPGSFPDFKSFVLPRLAGGPPASSGAAAQTPPAGSRARPSDQPGRTAGTRAAPHDATPSPQIVLNSSVQVAAGASADLSIPVPSASALAVMTTAPSTIGRTLYDPNGNAVDTVAAGSVQAQQGFYTSSTQNPAAGAWRLHLVSTDSSAQTVPVVATVTGAALALNLTVGQPTSDGHASLSAALTNNGTAVTGATVTATLSGSAGTTASVPLADQGGGVYSATAGPLAPDTYGVSLSASGSGVTAATLGTLVVAAPVPQVTAINPTSGPADGGTVVTITGTGFNTTAGATGVTVGGLPATNVTCSSATQCTATSPDGVGSVDVRVAANDQISPVGAADQFSYPSPCTGCRSPGARRASTQSARM